MAVPPLRIATLNDAPLRSTGEYVLYWMVANRRTTWNFSLDRALEHAGALKKPLLIFEALRVGYRWASDRFHKFVIDGMADNAARCNAAKVAYYPYVEPSNQRGQGLLAALAERACVVVSDDFPCFFLPHMLRLTAQKLAVRLEVVDSNGILPLRAANKVYSRAFDFRRFLQKSLAPHLEEIPGAEPLSNYDQGLLDIPRSILKRWPAADVAALSANADGLAAFPIDHAVTPSRLSGGPVAAENQLKLFVSKRLSRYSEERNHPDDDVASGLSPYLHFGHVSAHEVFQSVAKGEGWRRKDITGEVTGSAGDWWGGSPALTAYFDQLITWRELGYNLCWQQPNYDRYESLPAWAQVTLEKHADDPRPQLYDLEQLAAAETYDEVWNAAQRQLVHEGRIQNYLRMVWGKRLLEWTAHPRIALKYLIELNNRYALDGRNPNSYSGIFWVFGRYDRAWGPERKIYGTIRYMSSENTKRKLDMKQYLSRWSGSN